MTKYEAHRKAHELWHLFTGTGGARAVGDRLALLCAVGAP